MGSAKARVLPLPVRPRPRTSRPGHRVGQGGALDRERGRDAAAGEHVGERLRHAELGERVDHHDREYGSVPACSGWLGSVGAAGLAGLVGDGRGATATTALLGARAAAGTGGGGHDEGVLPEVVAVDAWPPSLRMTRPGERWNRRGHLAPERCTRPQNARGGRNCTGDAIAASPGAGGCPHRRDR